LIQAAFPRLPVRGRHFLFIAAALFLTSAQAETVWQKDNDFVRIVKADGTQASSSLPKLSSDAVRSALMAVQVSGDDGTGPLLTADQLDIVAAPIARALAEASPGQDVTFSVHGRSSFLDYLGPPRATAGRIFYDGDSLGLIVGMVKATFLSSTFAVDTDRIRTGSRMTAQETEHHIVPGGAVSLAITGRTDWARISPAAWNGTLGLPMAQAPAPASVAAPTPPPPAPVAAQPASPAMLAAPVPQDPNQIEQRFAALKRLLDSHMISQEEYDHAKADLLKAMSNLPAH